MSALAQQRSVERPCSSFQGRQVSCASVRQARYSSIAWGGCKFPAAAAALTRSRPPRVQAKTAMRLFRMGAVQLSAQKIPRATKLAVLVLLSVAAVTNLSSLSSGSGLGGGLPAMPAKPQPVLMFMYSRTGSSLMTEALNLHPRILFMPEMYNSEGHWQGTKPRVSYFFEGGYVDEYKQFRQRSKQFSAPPKVFGQLQAVGFKVRPLETGLLPGSKQWRVLERVRPKLICSHRRNLVKGTLSMLRADELSNRCGTANVIKRRNCSLPAGWVPAPSAFKRLLVSRMHEAQQFIDVCSHAAESFNTLFIAYEDLLDDLPGAMERILRFIDMPAADRAPFLAAIRNNTLPIGLRKNTPDNLKELLPSDSLHDLQAAAEQVFASEVAGLFA